MEYQVRFEKSFVSRMNRLGSLFGFGMTEEKEVRAEILDAIEVLASGNELDEMYNDHALQKYPWIGYREFHILEDLLVVYYKVDSKKRLRFVTITNHAELSLGKLPHK